MGRVADIVMRGLQFEAQQETRDLENEARRTQLQSALRERVAADRRVTPRYASAWDRFTNPETPTSELGGLLADIGAEDAQAAMQARQRSQEIGVKNEYATAKWLRDIEARIAAREDQQAHAAGLQNQRLDSIEYRQDRGIAATDARFKEREANLTERDREPREPKKPTYSVNEAADVIARQRFGVNFNELAEADVGGGLSGPAVAQAVASAANELIRLQDGGMDRAAALARVMPGLKITPGKKKRGPARLTGEDIQPVSKFEAQPDAPAKPAAAVAPQVDKKLEEAIIADLVADGEEDTPELREAVRQRLQPQQAK